MTDELDGIERLRKMNWQPAQPEIEPTEPKARLNYILRQHLGTDARCCCGWVATPKPQAEGEKGWPAWTHWDEHMTDVLMASGLIKEGEE
jgi:hypothetical protein